MSGAVSHDAGTQPMRTVWLTLKIPATSSDGNCSQPCIPARRFTVLGYEWQIDCHPDSLYSYGRPRWVNLVITLVRAPSSPVDANAVTASFTFSLVNPSRTLRPFREVAAQCPGFRQGSSKEVPLVSRAALESSGYLGQDGSFFVKCKTVLSHEPHGGDTSAEVRPGGLGHDLGDLLRSQNGADVTFVVGAESFRAHRCVLAARSPVFAAELAGSLMDETHEVKDMDADAFRALLFYIYTDTVPPQLKARCMLFLVASPEELLAVAAAGGFKLLEVSCPSVLTEILTAVAARNCQLGPG